MKIALASVLAATALLSGCGGGSSSSAEDCKAAMARQFEDALSNPNGPRGTRPAECSGFSASELTRFAGEAVAGSGSTKPLTDREIIAASGAKQCTTGRQLPLVRVHYVCADGTSLDIFNSAADREGASRIAPSRGIVEIGHGETWLLYRA